MVASVASVDFVSDLHVDKWSVPVRWDELATSKTCVVAGDISDDIDSAAAELRRMGRTYENILYVDGNHENKPLRTDVCRSEDIVARALKGLPSVHYLRRESVKLDGIGFVGACGWWTYAFAEPKIKASESLKAFLTATDFDTGGPFIKKARDDAAYLMAEAGCLARDPEVHSIVIVTHTVPDIRLMTPEYPRYLELLGVYGNELMARAVPETGGKARHWIFGHSHVPQDMVLDGVRYVSNPRGRPHDRLGRRPYRVMTIDLPTSVK